MFFSCVNWKYLFLDNYDYWNLVWKYFKMSLQLIFWQKNVFLSFYCNIFLSQYGLTVFTLDILTHSTYCDKKLFLSHGYLKAKVSSWQKKIKVNKETKQFKVRFLELTLFGHWNMWVNIIFLSQYLFIAISFYRNIVYQNVLCE